MAIHMKTEVTKNDDSSSHRKEEVSQSPGQALEMWEVLTPGQVVLCCGARPVHCMLFSISLTPTPETEVASHPSLLQLSESVARLANRPPLQTPQLGVKDKIH